MVQNEIVIDVRNVTKKFKIYYDKGSQLKERILFRKRSRYEERLVLKDISFQVRKGEAIGLIGHNGCGKSTTLKLLTKIMYPDSGAITMKGRVSSLIELGAGFHPDMSGRENIYTNAAIFGLTKKEIDSRLDDIIAFSELEQFIDNPVRTYSSGMYMRLAFSVAINVDADILLIDEILGVGDANFQAKCFNKLREIKASGTTIVIVSHSLGQIEQICERSIWIHDGLIRAEGPAKEIDLEYLEYMGMKLQENAALELERKAAQEKQRQESEAENDDASKSGDADSDSNSDSDSNDENSEDNNSSQPEQAKKRWGNGLAQITNIQVLSENGRQQRIFRTGEKVTFRVSYNVKGKVSDAVFGIGVFDRDGTQCYGTNTRIDRLPSFAADKNGQFEIEFSEMNLLPGEYTIDLAIESGGGIPVDYFRDACRIEMISSAGDVGIARLSHTWNLQQLS